MKHTTVNPFLKITLSLVITLSIVLTAIPSFSPPQRRSIESQSDFREYLNDRIPDYMDFYGIPGLSIALVEKGQLVWTQAYGWADRERGRSMTSDTPCRVESISKSLTAWGVMKLVQEDRIDLDVPLTTYLKSWQLPDSPFDENAITPRMLLTQTSGMPLGTIGVRYDPEGTLPSLREQLSQDAFLFQAPGTSFSYSNTGYNLLELLIEELTGRSFANYMRYDILLPLNMQCASFSWRSAYATTMPKGYDNKGKSIEPYIYPDKASGGLFARAADIAAFTCAGMSGFNDNSVLSKEMIDEIYSIQSPISGFYSLAFKGYGFGHFIETLEPGLNAMSHGGQGSGWMTHFHSVPETGDAIVMLTNSQNSWPFFAYMLRDWSIQRNLGSPGMTAILAGTRLMWIVIGLLIYVSLILLWTVTADLISGKRALSPFSSQKRGARLILFLIVLTLWIILLWTELLPYFFLPSIFPVAAGWLGKSLIALSLMFLGFALCPLKPQSEIHIID